MKQHQSHYRSDRKQRINTLQRLVNLGLLVGIGIMAVVIWSDGTDTESKFIKNQSRIIGNSYLAQTARVHRAYLAGDDNDSVIGALNDVLTESYIHSLQIISASGDTRFSLSQENAAPLTISEHASNKYLIYIEPLQIDGKVAGFTKVVLLRTEVEALQRSHYRQQSSRTMLLLILAVLMGGLCWSVIQGLQRRVEIK